MKATNHLLAAGVGVNFVGNVEVRDLMTDSVDVVVTDGFTGNVALKTLEGALRFFMGVVASRLPGDALAPLLPVAAELDPDATGGAMLLGVDGVCVISHGSSGALAIVNAVRVAAESVGAGLVDKLRDALRN